MASEPRDQEDVRRGSSNPVGCVVVGCPSVLLRTLVESEDTEIRLMHRWKRRTLG